MFCNFNSAMIFFINSFVSTVECPCSVANNHMGIQLYVEFNGLSSDKNIELNFSSGFLKMSTETAKIPKFISMTQSSSSSFHNSRV